MITTPPPSTSSPVSTASRMRRAGWGLMKIDDSQITYIRLDDQSVLTAPRECRGEVDRYPAGRHVQPAAHHRAAGRRTVKKQSLPGRPGGISPGEACRCARFFGFRRPLGIGAREPPSGEADETNQRPQAERQLPPPRPRLCAHPFPDPEGGGWPSRSGRWRWRPPSWWAACTTYRSATARCSDRYASDQQLLDSTIQATRGEIYDATGKVLASTSVVWDIWCDPSYSSALYNSQTPHRHRRSRPGDREHRPHPGRRGLRRDQPGDHPAAAVGGTASAWIPSTRPRRSTPSSMRKCMRPSAASIPPTRCWPRRSTTR